MKAKLAIVTVISLVACNLVMAQADSPATPDSKPAAPDAQPATPDSPSPAPEAQPEKPAEQPAAPEAKPAEREAQVAAADTTTPAAPETKAASTETKPAATKVSATELRPGNGASAPGDIIPLIHFQGVPLTTVIENLARQANLNYILDPKVGYGQPDEKTGGTRVEPNISIRWENLTAEQALGGLLATYGLQIVEDPKTKINRVTVKDPAAPDPLLTRIIQLKYSAPSNVIAALQGTLTDKRSKVVPDTRTSQLVILATEKELVSVDDLVVRLDIPPKQVLIEAKIMETSMNPSTVKGIDWSGTLKEQKFTFGNGKTVGTVTSERGRSSVSAAGTGADPLGAPGVPPSYASTVPYGAPMPNNVGAGAINGSALGSVLTTLVGAGGLGLNTASGFNPSTAFLNADGVSAVLSFLNTSADAKVIATPRAVTLDNETANLSVTRAFPIFKNTAGTEGSPGGSEITYTNVGTILTVTPRISANNYVNLRVVPEVSSVFQTIRKTVSDTVNEADVFDIRKIETQVMIPSGNTLVLGGLVSDKSNKGHKKVPILGDIPIVGLAFRQDSKSRDQANLLIFVTPTIVKDSDFQPTSTDFLQSKADNDAEEKWGAWDSGEPFDWSKQNKKKK